jgi:flagellar hook-associated protein 2
MAGVSLSGMASGLDTENIIRQLMAIEAQSKNRLVKTEKLAIGRKTAMDDVARQLRALSTAMADLRSAGTWGDVQKLTSTKPELATARQLGPAPAGTFSVEVITPAQAAQQTYTYTEDLTGPPPRDQEITVNGKTVTIPQGSTRQQVADQLNASGIDAYAGVIVAGGEEKLVFTAKQVGEPLTVTSSSGSLASFGTDTPHTLWTYKVNGMDQTPSKTPVVNPGSLPGVELTLRSVGALQVQIGAPAPDSERITAKVKAFTDAYNATLDLIGTKLKEERPKTPASTADFTKGALRNDPALQGLATRLRQMVQGADATPETIDSLAEIGVAVPRGSTSGTSSAEALAGKLTIDTEKLAASLAGSPADVRKLLGATSGFEGVIGSLEDLVDPVGKSVTGYLARGAAAADAEASNMRTRQTDLDRRLKIKEDRLREQFTALETALNRSNSQTSWVQGQISGLPSWK